MNLSVSEEAGRLIRSHVESGQYASEAEVIEAAVRRLESDPSPRTADDVSIADDQELQRRLFAAGLISEIRPSVRVDTGTEQFAPITIEGEPLSETVIRERR